MLYLEEVFNQGWAFMDNLFVRSWKGQASLAAAFWIIYFVAVIVLYLVVFYIMDLIRPGLKTSPMFGSIIAAIIFPYVIYSAICVWRCAKNSNAVWKILARIIMVLVVLSGIFNIIGLLGLQFTHA